MEISQESRPETVAEARRRSIWRALDTLLAGDVRVSDLEAHRVQVLAARRWRTLGRSVSDELVVAERLAALRVLTAPVLLERVRAAYDGPMILVKGLEAAGSYPDPVLRPFVDVDLLVPDAGEAQRTLVAAGFVPIGDPALYVDIHHERPLALPGLPVYVELHKEPKWPAGLAPPPIDELLAVAVPSSCGVEGVLALPAAEHALLLAAHSWAHTPLRRLLDLVDIAFVTAGLDRVGLEFLARRWDLERLWAATQRAIDALFFGSRLPMPLRVWARNLPAMRERTVFENHLEHWLSSFSALPLRQAARTSASKIGKELHPAPGESWGAKLSRTRRALLDGFVRLSEHDRSLDRD